MCIRSIYEYPDYYPVTSPGCIGDVDFYVQEVRNSGSPVLEIGCGTGRTAIPIAQAGVDVLGIDNSEAMLAACCDAVAKLGREGQRPKTELADMRSLEFAEKFQTVIIPYRAFLHLHSAREQLDTLSGIHRALRSGGRLILNVFDPDVETLYSFSKGIGSHRVFRTGIVPGKGTTLLTWATTSCDLDQQMIHEIWTYEEFDEQERVGSRFYGRFTIRYVFRHEMEHLLSRAGFRVEELLGDFDRSDYKPGGEQIWICRK